MPFLHRLTALATTLLAATLLPASSAHAQLGEFAATAGASAEAFRFTNPEEIGIRELRLLTAPIGAAVDVGIARVDLSSAFAHGEITRPDGSRARLTGPTDTRVALTVPLAGRSVSLTAFALLPTGSTLEGAGEADVAGVVAADLLPLSITHWGAGGGAGVAASVRRPVGSATVFAGASYLLSGEHDASEDAGLVRYRAGDQIGARVGLESRVGRGGELSVEVGFQHLADDQLAGTNLYRPGSRVQAIGSYAFLLGRESSGVLYAGGQYRQRGAALLEITRDSPAQALALAGAGFRFPLVGSTMLLPTVHARALRSADGVGQGFLGGGGLAIEINHGPLRIEPALRAHVGRVLMSGDRTSGLLGVNGGLSVSVRRPL